MTIQLNRFLFLISNTIVLLVLTGCSKYLHFTNTIPSEYNLEGVSKIALIEFNSLPNDPITGIYSVDNETKKIVKDMISTVFFKGKTYKVKRIIYDFSDFGVKEYNKVKIISLNVIRSFVIAEVVAVLQARTIILTLYLFKREEIMFFK